MHSKHAGLLIDGELVVLGRVDLFSVKERDNEHDAVLSSERGLARSYDRPVAGPVPLWSGGVKRAETLHDNQSRALPGAIEKCAGQDIGRQIRVDDDRVPRLFIG